MRNHDQKVKDMAESVLPSTARVMARRGKRAINRKERRQVRQRLGVATTYVDPDDFDGDLIAVDRAARKDLRYDRRSMDKVAPLLRWAAHRVANDPALRDTDFEGRLAYFRSLLPSNKIGRHALGHIEWEIDDRWQRPSYGGSRIDVCTDEFRSAAKLVIETGRHGRLNELLRAQRYSREELKVVEGERVVVRTVFHEGLLRGFHDVDEFAKARRYDVIRVTRELAGMAPCGCSSCQFGQRRGDRR